jgi:hypothetical protein
MAVVCLEVTQNFANINNQTESYWENKSDLRTLAHMLGVKICCSPSPCQSSKEQGDH